MQIELGYGYFFVSCKSGFRLKRRSQGRSKSGEVVERETSLGYYTDMEGCIESFLKKIQAPDDVHTYFQDLVHRIEKSNQQAVQAILTAIEKSTQEVST